MELQRLQSPGAVRAERHYRRRRQGLVVYSFEGDEIEVPEILIAAGLLNTTDVENRDAISRALARWFEVIKKEKGL